MKARFYDPELGQFLNQDAFEGTADTPPSLHRYLYAFGNPVFYVDLDGNEPQPSQLLEGVFGTSLRVFRRDLTRQEVINVSNVRVGVQGTAAAGMLAQASLPLVVPVAKPVATSVLTTGRSVVQGGRAIAAEVKQIGLINTLLARPAATSILATEAAVTGTAVVSGADVPLSSPVSNASKKLIQGIKDFPLLRQALERSSDITRKTKQLTTLESPGNTGTRLVVEGDSVGAARVDGTTVSSKGFVSGDPGQLRNIVRKARQGDTAAQGELETIKRLRARGENVHAVDPELRPGVTSDIFFGGKVPKTPLEAVGTKGEIKTLAGPDFVENSAKKAIEKAASQLQPEGGTVFLNTRNLNDVPESVPNNLVEKIKNNEVVLDEPLPTNVDIEVIK